MKIETLGDITATGVRLALGRMKDSGKALRTCNARLTTLKAFLNWCRLDGRLVEDVLLAVEPYDHETDPRHPRRAPSVEEINRLLATARARTDDQCRMPVLSDRRHRRKERGSGRSRTDDGGFAIRCLSHLATEP